MSRKSSVIIYVGISILAISVMGHFVFQKPATVKAEGFMNTPFSHIKLWGLFAATGTYPGEDMLWAAAKWDFMAGKIYGNGNMTRGDLKAINPNLNICDYINPPEWHDGAFADLEAWANANGYNFEDLFVHYTQDVHDDFWNIDVKGYRAECSPDNCTPPATASSPTESRVHSGWYPSPNWRMRRLNYSPSILYEINLRLNKYQEPDPVNCLLLDAIPMFDFITGLFKLNETDRYAGYPYDYSHPRIQELFQFGLDYNAELNSSYSINLSLLPNATASAILNGYPFEEKFVNMYDWAWVENWMSYKYDDEASGQLSYEASYSRDIVNILDQTLAGEKRLLRGNENYLTANDRGKIFLLAAYYLINNQNTWFDHKLTGTYDSVLDNPHNHWFEGIGYDVGVPTTNPYGKADYAGNLNTTQHYEWLQGDDPASDDPTKIFHILARNYSNALVLVKYRPQGSTIVDSSATTHDLGGTYKPLNADGTLGATITQVTLRNNEAAILIPVDETAPETVDDLTAN